MRYLSASWIHPLHIPPIREGVIQVSDSGEIIKLFNNRNQVDRNKLEVFDGILCPGFINAHCHLELSHLIGVIEKGRGILNFIKDIQCRNNFTNEDILLAIELSENTMIKNGIVAVADICNTLDTLFQKEKKNLTYYNFIEVFGVHDENVKQIVSSAKILRDKFRKSEMKATISPHSSYSVPPKLMNEISSVFDKNDDLYTIHMQESIEENKIFSQNTGNLINWLKDMNSSSAIWENRDSSLDVLLELKDRKILLVHNTYSTKSDLAQQYYCTCPKANIYIENSLPDYKIFNTDKLCVGTDSLASNDTLSILCELKVIRDNSDYSLDTLLKIASKNGAEALGFEKLGTFEKGKKPGINLLDNLNSVEVII